MYASIFFPEELLYTGTETTVCVRLETATQNRTIKGENFSFENIFIEIQWRVYYLRVLVFYKFTLLMPIKISGS